MTVNLKVAVDVPPGPVAVNVYAVSDCVAAGIPEIAPVDVFSDTLAGSDGLIV